MGKQTIRPACAQDVHMLSVVKSRYLRALYRGFLSSEYLKKLDENYFEAELTDWVAGQYQVDVLLDDETPIGFIVYGAERGTEDCGLLREVALIPSDSWQGMEPLMRSCLERLSRRYSTIYARTLRDNFHTRFLFEQYGFRPDGTLETYTVDGDELRTIRLVRRT